MPAAVNLALRDLRLDRHMWRLQFSLPFQYSEVNFPWQKLVSLKRCKTNTLLRQQQQIGSGGLWSFYLGGTKLAFLFSFRLIKMIFDIENWLWKLKFEEFIVLIFTKYIKLISLKVIHFTNKIKLILYLRFRNSIIHLTISSSAGAAEMSHW